MSNETIEKNQPEFRVPEGGRTAFAEKHPASEIGPITDEKEAQNGQPETGSATIENVDDINAILARGANTDPSGKGANPFDLVEGLGQALERKDQ